MSISSTQKTTFLVLAVLIAAIAAACSQSDSPPSDVLGRAVLQVREHLSTLPVEGDESNPSCLFLVERDGPRSVQWVAEEAEDGKITVEARKGGRPVRGFTWLWDWRTTEVTSNSTLC